MCLGRVPSKRCSNVPDFEGQYDSSFLLNETTALTQDGAKTEIRLVVPLQYNYLLYSTKSKMKYTLLLKLLHSGVFSKKKRN